MPSAKTIGFLFIDRFADWEYGLLSASAVEWFGARAVSLTPTGEPVVSTSGFRLVPDRGADPAENADLGAIAVIGSEVWTARAAPEVSMAASFRRRARRPAPSPMPSCRPSIRIARPN